ncbi:unnamed protein product [Rotaria magnacalcarata]|uniref:F-box domain-containing protein n=1 Tax=Rotaria magnacalcarata TaxID=392030 RepID=A0A8S3AMY6_9BILA|nr:unnamed protein product [Rotaria magnacalcarata]
MQVVGKKILLQNRSVAYKVNKPLLINNYNQQLVATEPISADLVGLPIEVLYRIFDYLDAQTILLSLQYICRRLRDVSEKYDRYSLDFENISMVQMWHVCRLIRSESILSLNLSDGPRTPQGIDVDDIFHTIFKYVHGCRSVESFSIHSRRASLFGRPDLHDYDYGGPSFTLLALAIAKSNLNTFKTNLPSRFHIFIRCSMEEKPFSAAALMASFQTPFWTEEKHWFFTCEPRLPDSCLFYSASMRTMTHPYTLYMGDNARSNFDEINNNAEMMNAVGKLHFEPTKMQYFNSREKNITGQSFFPNVTILYLKFHDNWPSDGIEFVSSLIDMSRATTLELCYDRKIDSISDSIVHVEKLFGQAVNVSILVVFGYRRLYYRFKWEKLCSVIPHHVKHLSSSASDSEDMKNILDHLKHLWSIRFQWPTGIISEDKGTCSREIINNLKMKKQNFKYQYDDFELQIWLSNP